MTTAADLLGTWQLIAWEIDGGGRLEQPFGPRPVGLLSYTPDGWMQASIAAAERHALSGPSTRSSPDVEVAATARSYFSYAGRWWLETGRDEPFEDNVEVVCHEVVVALDPAMVGSIQRRHAHLDAGRLTLAAAEEVGTTIRHHRLVWQPADAAGRAGEAPQTTSAPAARTDPTASTPTAPHNSTGTQR